MTQTLIDRAKVVAVIEAEQRLIGEEMVERFCESPGHCALGALLFAAGIPNHRLKERVAQQPIDWPADLDTTMREAYGLRRRHCQDIMQANDNDDVVTSDKDALISNRRRRVVDRVNYICDQQAEKPKLDEVLCDKFDGNGDGDLPF